MSLTKKHYALLGRAIDAWTIAPRNYLITTLLDAGLVDRMYYLGRELWEGTPSRTLRQKIFLWRLTDAGRSALSLARGQTPGSSNG